MKNQYTGDVGDYGKYGLLRFLKDSGIEIGVNWYLTPDDGTTDGKFLEYLRDDRMRIYDPEVFDAMKRIAFQKGKSIALVEQEGFLEGVCFYNQIMDLTGLQWRERANARQAWHEGAMQALQNVSLVFADPDNGLSVRQKPTMKYAQKFILPSEIVDYYTRGQQVMYYHHRSRADAGKWMQEKRQILSFLPDARLLAVSFHRWSSRTYLFVVHEEQYAFYDQVLREFLRTAWGAHTIDGKKAFSAEAI